MLSKIKERLAEYRERLIIFLLSLAPASLRRYLFIYLFTKRVGEPDTFETILELAMSVIVVGVLFPIAMPYVITATFGTTSLAQTLATLFSTLISITAVIVVVLLFLKYRKSA